VRLNAIEEMSNEGMQEIGQNIDCENLISGQNAEQQAEDLRKVLILAGLKVDTELNDPETMELI